MLIGFDRLCISAVQSYNGKSSSSSANLLSGMGEKFLSGFYIIDMSVMSMQPYFQHKLHW